MNKISISLILSGILITPILANNVNNPQTQVNNNINNQVSVPSNKMKTNDKDFEKMMDVMIKSKVEYQKQMKSPQEKQMERQELERQKIQFEKEKKLQQIETEKELERQREEQSRQKEQFEREQLDSKSQTDRIKNQIEQDEIMNKINLHKIQLELKKEKLSFYNSKIKFEISKKEIELKEIEKVIIIEPISKTNIGKKNKYFFNKDLINMKINELIRSEKRYSRLKKDIKTLNYLKSTKNLNLIKEELSSLNSNNEFIDNNIDQLQNNLLIDENITITKIEYKDINISVSGIKKQIKNKKLILKIK